MRLRTLIITAFAGLVGFGSCSLQQTAAQTPEEIQLMRKTMPDQPRVEPRAPRKLLVNTTIKGFPHSAIPYGAKAFEVMSEITGAFDVVVSDDIAMFEPANLKQFDAVLLNNTTGNLFLPHPKKLSKLSDEEKKKAQQYDEALKKSLSDFVKNGGGLIGVHAATDCHYAWPEYGEMMGGRFSGHPWNEAVTVKIDDPAHPINKAFKGSSFVVADEIYQFNEPYSREKLRVLLSLDTSKTDMDKGKAIRRTDGDFAVSWVRSYGEGRVFYCSLGHRHEIFWNPVVLQHYLDGIQFALGDLDADTTPSAQLPDDYVEQSMAGLNDQLLEQSLKEIAQYEYGQAVTAMNFVETRVRATCDDSQARAKLARHLAALLDTDATLAGKRFICKQLSLCGTPEIAPVLVHYVADPDLSDLVLYALAAIPGELVDELLRQALSETGGNHTVGVINALGDRRCQSAARKLTALIGDRDAVVADAAAAALGKIGGPVAVEALGATYLAAPVERRPALADAQLACANRLLAQDEREPAAAIFQRLLAESQSQHVKAGAISGLIRAGGTQAVPVAIIALASTLPELRGAALQSIRDTSAADLTRALCEQRNRLSLEAKILLINALADRGDSVALDAVVAETKSEHPAVALAAVRALGSLGNATTVDLLAETAATATADLQSAARTSLTKLRGSEVDAAIVAAIREAEPTIRYELVRSLAPRNAVSAVATLMKTSRDENDTIKKESLRALGELGTSQDLYGLTVLAMELQGDMGRSEAEDAVAAVALKNDSIEASAAAILDAIPVAGTVEARCSLLRIMGKVGADSMLQLVKVGTGWDDPRIRDAALRALADWRNSAPLKDLLDLAATADTERQRETALRGALRMMSADRQRWATGDFTGRRSTAKEIDLYKNCMALAQSVELKKLVLDGLGHVRSDQSKAVLSQHLKDDALRASAQQAINKLETSPYSMTATINGGPGATKKVFDGKPRTKWTTGEPQQGGEYIMLDLGAVEMVRKIKLDSTGSPNEYPREYTVHASLDKVDWNPNPIAQGTGTEGMTEIALSTPVKARFFVIMQRGDDEKHPWSIHELIVELD